MPTPPDTPRDNAFRQIRGRFIASPAMYAMQGYDTGLLLIQGANAVKGDLSAKPAFAFQALERHHRQTAPA